ncbi:MAG: hypothetical protein MUO97_02745, partial [Dehalococcoidia bacterium]|nr:hypothetical protein [Dehalococcoidia bacterium]
MDWFERHLNWSLFFGTSLLPFVVIMILGAISFAVFGGELAPVVDSGMEEFSEAMGAEIIKTLPILIVLMLVNLALSVFALIVAWWYLGQKARSKWFLLLVLVPGGLAVIFRSSNIIIGLLIFLVALVCIIILYRLENKRIGYGGDFVGEPVTDRWPDEGQFSAYDNGQPKELEYRDVSDVSVASGEAPAETSAEATVETLVETPAVTPAELPAEAKVTEEVVRQETLNMPILLDNAGVVMKCFYHPDADAVNLCSRCRQYVCSQCNYVTGTHPICRNCWDKRAETPISPVSPEAQKSPKLSKSEKRKAEEDERLREFMQLYEQALPVISAVIKKGADGLPASPSDLTEWLKLRPMLEHVKKLSKPKEKELHEAKKEFEQLLLACSKVAETAE